MKNFAIRIALACLAAGSAMPAQAQQQAPAQEQQVNSSGGFLLGRMLYASCISQEAQEQLACRTYIMGIADAMAMHKDNGWAPQVLCNARDMRIDQLGPIYVDFIRRNPTRADWTAASTAYTALAERFPCPQAQ